MTDLVTLEGVGTFSTTELEASLYQESFWEFILHFWEFVPGAGRMVYNWHMKFLADELQTLAERVFQGLPRLHDLVINISPGTSKSSIASILFPAWVWTRFPHGRFICASHTDSLVIDLADKSKQVIECEEYRRLFPQVQIRSDKSAKDDFANTAGGERKSCTVGGKTPTGRHAHFLVVDDALDPQTALSEASLLNARNFMTNVIPTRKVDKEVAVTILIMQRLHHSDPTAVMMETSQKEGASAVRRIKLPAEIEDGPEPLELAQYYQDGLMDPYRLNRRVLKEAYANLGPYGYSGQFRQSPVPLGGGMFLGTWFTRIVKAAPYHAKRVLSWDRASTSQGGCATAGVLMARDAEGYFYVEHCVHGHWEPHERNRRILAEAQRCRRRYGPKNEPTIVIEDEGGSTAKDANQALARQLAGFRVKFIKPTGDKDTRAEPWACQLEAGNVYLVDDGSSSWDINGFIQEHELFKPEKGMKRGKLKDRVDSSSQGCAYLTGSFRSGGMRILESHKKQSGLRIVVCSREELVTLVIEDHPCLLVSFQDPSIAGEGVVCSGGPANGNGAANGNLSKDVEGGAPGHGITKLLGALVLTFADLNPADFQDRWTDPIQPWNLPPEKLVMNAQEHGKKLWSFLTKQRQPIPEVYVFQDEGDGRALSAAMAVCDVKGLPRKQVIYPVSQGEVSDNLTGEIEGLPANPHVFAVVKSSRALVI